MNQMKEKAERVSSPTVGESHLGKARIETDGHSVEAALSHGLSSPKSFLFAPEAQWILAGGETTGTGVVIAFAPWQGAGPKHCNKNFRSPKFRPAPLPGCDVFTLGFRWFHHRLMSTALLGQIQESLNAKDLGNDKSHGRATDTLRVFTFVALLLFIAWLYPKISTAQVQNTPNAKTAPTPISSEDERARAERGQELLQKARQAIGGTAMGQLQTLSAKAKLQRFIKYFSVQSPIKVVEKSKTIGGKVEIDFDLPDRFRKRLASKTLFGWGYDYEEVINGERIFRDPPLRVTSSARDQRVIDVGDVERTLNVQTASVQQQVSIFTLVTLLQLPPNMTAKWLHLGEYNLDGRIVDVVLAQRDDFNPFILLDKQTNLPAALAFAYTEAFRPTVIPEVAAVDRRYIFRTYQRAAQERRARTEPVKRHELRWLLSDYRNVNGVLLPHVITVMRDNEKIEEMTFEEFKLNRPINPKKFAGEAKVVY